MTYIIYMYICIDFALNYSERALGKKTNDPCVTIVYAIDSQNQPVLQFI